MESKVFLILVISLSSIIGLSSCQNLAKEDYVQWVRQNLTQKVSHNEFMFEVQYKPNPYVVLMQEGRNVNKGVFDKSLKDAEGLAYFDLKISMKDPKMDILKYNTSNKKEIEERIYYYSFDFQKTVYLEQKGKRIPCSRFHFEHSYDLTNQRSFVLGFETDQSLTEGPAKIIIESAAFGKESIEIPFVKTEIPTVKI